jgi:hypothetical protein
LTDTQLLTLALSVIIPISVMIYSNSRVAEVSKRIDDLSKKHDDTKTDLSKKIEDLKTHLDEKIDNAFAHMELLLKLHEAEHHKK